MNLRTRSFVAALFGTCACWFSATAGHADPPLTPEQRRTLELVAAARARTGIMAQLPALPLDRQQTLAGWLSAQAELDRALRLWTRTLPRSGEMRLYSYRVVEVDVRLAPAELLAELTRLAAELAPAGRAAEVDASRLEAAARQWPVLWATGRATLPTDTPRAVGWEDVSSEGLELARAAASADAYAALLEAAGRLKLGGARRVHEFLQTSPAVRQLVQAEIQRAARVRVEFAPDRVAVVQARLEIKELLRILTQAHQGAYEGDEFAAADFRAMALHAEQEELVATGLGLPPSHTVSPRRFAGVDLDVPEWASRTLRALGEFRPPAGAALDSVALEHAARLDAIEQLYLEVEQLIVQGEVTVADYLSYHHDLKADAALWLSGARVARPPTSLSNGGVEVQVELPAQRLWEILRRNMKTVEIMPPEPAPTTAPA